MSLLERFRTPVILLLVFLIVAGAALFLYRRGGGGGELEIVLAPTPGEVVVYVGGAVAESGVYHLPAGSRVEDALIAAGGATARADLTGVNLAATLYDGDHLHIPEVGEAPQKININTAEAWLLQALKGIGEARAEKIVASREEEGPFTRIEELVERGLIPSSVFEEIKDSIAVH